MVFIVAAATLGLMGGMPGVGLAAAIGPTPGGIVGVPVMGPAMVDMSFLGSIGPVAVGRINTSCQGT